LEELTVEEVIDYHIVLMKDSSFEDEQNLGGKFLNESNFRFVIDFSSNFKDPVEKAAYLLHGITTGHPFIQGNKRLAFLLSALVLY
jgi:death-on-curing protein